MQNSGKFCDEQSPKSQIQLSSTADTTISYKLKIINQLFSILHFSHKKKLPLTKNKKQLQSKQQLRQQLHPQLESDFSTTTILSEKPKSYIATNQRLNFNWSNIDQKLILAGENKSYEILLAADEFLAESCKDNPLKSFRLSDKYNLPKSYKESSKLILDNLNLYRRKDEFKLLSEQAKRALYERRWEFDQGLKEIYSFVKRGKCGSLRHNNCGVVVSRFQHHELVGKEIKERINAVLVSQVTAPSKIHAALLRNPKHQSNAASMCVGINEWIEKKLLTHCGKFEPLECERIRIFRAFYIYVELNL
ncbi:3790_t:CDS:1 [Ambispora gerdemannii]|uniref:3790_t:CDS:1 n=1 Tax=Ambispora gerdemannii TaxID=144530 RepID=A0A9N9A8L2_9GLOM|nr:3790_t:CDS:1 [Ambispora gerdemannii]